MVNTFKKGYRTMCKARKYYESRGYRVEAVVTTQWKKDFWGLWDLICISSRGTVLSQVKCNGLPTKEWYYRAEVFEVPDNCVKVVDVYKDYQRGNAPSRRIILQTKYTDLD